MKGVKAALITGSILICIGIIVVVAVGFSSGWNFAKTKWDSAVYESQLGTEISAIDLEFSAGSLKVEFYDGDVIRVEYPESKRVTTEFKVTGQTLKISTVVHWHMQFLWFNKIPETKMFIPQNMQLKFNVEINAGAIELGTGAFDNISIEMNAGAINMGSVNCNTFDLKMSAGAVNVSQIVSNKFKADISAGALNVKGLQCDNIDLDLSAGSAKLGIVGKKSDYTILTDVSAGSCNVSSQTGGSKRLNIDVSAGSVNISFEE